MCHWDSVEAEVSSANNKLSSSQEVACLAVNRNQADFSVKVNKHNKKEVSSKLPNNQQLVCLVKLEPNPSVDYSKHRDKEY